MIDIWWDYLSYSIRYGLLSWATLALTLIALFRNRKLRKRINRFLPPLFRDDDSEVSKYIQNQIRIESKVDFIIYLIFAICKHFLIPVKRWEEWDGNIKTSSNTEARSYRRLSLLLQMVKNRKNRRIKRMKLYLKKLGSRKFQALLVSLVVNITSAVLFSMGIVDIDGVVNQWMPIINMTIGTISTWVYIWVEGSTDKASVQKEANPVDQLNIPIEPTE